jgi:hypothetical protein
MRTADISFLLINIFVEVSKIWKNGKRVLYIYFFCIVRTRNLRISYVFPPRNYLHSVRRQKSSRYSPVSFNFKDRKSDCLVKFPFNSFALIVYTASIHAHWHAKPAGLSSAFDLRSEFPKPPWFDGCPIAHSHDAL